MTSLPCPACRGRRREHEYLCLDCWRQLSNPARRQLLRRGAGSVQRLRQLLDQIRDGVPLGQIRIE